jgi:hypothetical protein
VIAEVGIPLAPVAVVPARIHRELRQVGQTADILRAGGLAARKRAELIEIDGRPAVRFQERVNEIVMAVLVIGVLLNIVRVIVVDVLQCLIEGRVVARQLVVLLPQVGFEELGGGQPSQDVDVAALQMPVTILMRRAKSPTRSGSIAIPAAAAAPVDIRNDRRFKPRRVIVDMTSSPLIAWPRASHQRDIPA